MTNNQTKGTNPLPISYPLCLLPSHQPRVTQKGGQAPGTLDQLMWGAWSAPCQVSQPTPTHGPSRTTFSPQLRQKMMLKLTLHRLRAIWLQKQAAPLEGALADKGSKVRRCSAQTHLPKAPGTAQHWSQGSHTQHTSVTPVRLYAPLQLPKSLRSQALKP